jgi:Fe2+ or Zn2+ uptake regulation protein
VSKTAVQRLLSRRDIPAVYRALQRLEALGLIRTVGVRTS